MITCPTCGRQNRSGAKFCRYCGADFSPARDLRSAGRERGQPPDARSSPLRRLMHRLRRLGQGPRPATDPDETSAPSTRPLPVQPQPAPERPAPPDRPPARRHPTRHPRPFRRGEVLTHPQHRQQRYSIVTAQAGEHAITYDAIDLTCGTCGTSHQELPLDGTCASCGDRLAGVLIHEQELPPGRRHPDSEIEHLLRLSADDPGILPHRDIIQYQKRIYTVVEHPGRWDMLVHHRRRRSIDETLASALQVGRALNHLHANGFAYSGARSDDLESLIVDEAGLDTRLADLALSAPLPDEPEGRQAHIERDVAFIGRLLFYLGTGKELEGSDASLAPDQLRGVVSRAVQGDYRSLESVLADLAHLSTGSFRSLKPSHGQRTHRGKLRSRNEDAIVTFTFDKEQSEGSVPIGFYLVADGMGGHEAGDIASRTVNEIVTDWIISTSVLPNLRRTPRKLATENVPGQLLREAIQEANEALSRRGRTEGSDLGSTVTAALIIGDVATIANVGDSRTYLLRNSRLQQVTRDHSLVARLVDTGVIEAAEVREHPQRNEVYRCLGQGCDMDVDIFTRQLREGDVLILCSDGLWEMVLDDEIQRIVEGAHSLQRACDELVEAANRAGGEDNIAVVVVEME